MRLILGGLAFVWAGLDVMSEAVASGRYSAALGSLAVEVRRLAEIVKREYEGEGGATGHGK